MKSVRFLTDNSAICIHLSNTLYHIQDIANNSALVKDYTRRIKHVSVLDNTVIGIDVQDQLVIKQNYSVSENWKTIKLEKPMPVLFAEIQTGKRILMITKEMSFKGINETKIFGFCPDSSYINSLKGNLDENKNLETLEFTCNDLNNTSFKFKDFNPETKSQMEIITEDGIQKISNDLSDSCRKDHVFIGAFSTKNQDKLSGLNFFCGPVDKRFIATSLNLINNQDTGSEIIPSVDLIIPLNDKIDQFVNNSFMYVTNEGELRSIR
jgi:hypothetical protein